MSIDYESMYHQEVAAHRQNVLLLHAAWADRDAMARSFMDFHDLAKRFAGPKLTKDKE